MSTFAATGPEPALAVEVRRARYAVIAILVLLILSFSMPYGLVASMLGKSQDLPAAFALCLFLIATKFGSCAPLARLPDITRLSEFGWRVPAAGALLFLLAAFGPEIVMGGHVLSRDEQMVVFDAEVFAAGELVAAVPPEWQGRLHELRTLYMRTADDQSAWISGYLPINAMAHAIGLKVGAFTLVAPAFAALGLVATWGVARHLFPDDRRIPAVVAVLYVTSSQVWVTAMTPYAMSGHLGLNMAWLWLVLGTSVRRHVAAAAVSFCAVGLHQLLFHPMFCLPFIALLAWRGHRRTALAQAGFLLVSVSFWSVYPSLVLTEGTMPGRADGLGGIVVHALQFLLEFKPYAVSSMAGNVLRFVVWQNFALLPLLVGAVIAVRRHPTPILLALWGALLITPIVMAFLIPEEHHGWGYRYMHGQIGVVCLLGAVGFRHLIGEAKALPGFLTAAVAFAVCVQLPFLTFETARFVHPFAEANAELEALPRPTVVVDDRENALFLDLVYNGPGLDEPVRLLPPRLVTTSQTKNAVPSD